MVRISLADSLKPIAQAVAVCIALAVSSTAQTQTTAANPAAKGSNSTPLPNLGDGADMSPSAERRLGDRIARELYRDPDYIDDPVVLQYVQGLWQKLLAASRSRGELPPQLDEAFAWEILLGKDRTVNAFALPGGYMGLHLGLIAIVSNRDELASVIAHELSHITQRHISRGISKQSAQAPWLMGAMILGILAASKDPNAGNAMMIGGQAASAQNQLNFSRDVEREADRIGFAVMTQAGYEPQGFVSMFEKLQQSSRLNDSGGFPYLRTHPLTTERIADMQARVPQKAGGSALPVTPPDHAMVAARAKVLANSGVDALRLWSLELEPAHFAGLSASAQIGTLYGATFAAMKLRDFTQAQATLPKLMERVRNHAAAREIASLLGAELALAQGSPEVAAQRMAGVAGNGRSVVLMNAQIDISGGRATKAAQYLQVWLAEHPRDALGWQLLAQANQSLGRTVAAVRDEAESNMSQLDYQAAFTRFKAAQSLARKSTDNADHIEASIVDTRARQVELVLKEQALER